MSFIYNCIKNAFISKENNSGSLNNKLIKKTNYKIATMILKLI